MILRKILLGLIVVGFIAFIIYHLESCNTREVQAKAKLAPIKRYQVKLLFDIDGCKVYSFQDGSSYNYFTNCNVEHDCIVDDFASISAGVVLGGKVKVGKYSAIALNATIFDRLTIGQNTVIGAASLVTKNIPDNVLAYGNPVKIIRNRIEGEKFLK